MANLGEMLLKEYEVIKDRKENMQEGSYTCYLFNKGLDKILKKIGEEATETIIAAKNSDKGEIVGDDQPETLLMNEKLLQDLHLDTPFALKVSRKLKAQGIQINETLNVEELEKQLCQLHAKI